MRWTNLRWVLLAALLAGYIALGISRISFNVDVLRLLPTHLPQVEGLSLFLKSFARPNELIITLEGPDPDACDAAADSLADLLNAHRDLVDIAVGTAPYEKSPASLSELLAYLVLNQPPDKVRAMVRQLTPENAPKTLQDTLEKLGESLAPQEVAMLSYDPYNMASALPQFMAGTSMQSEFSSADGTFRVVYVEAPKAFGDYRETIIWMDKVKALVNAWNASRGLKIGYTGEPAFVSEISASMQFDMLSSGVVTMILIAGIFWFCYRRIRPLNNLIFMLALTFMLSLATAGLFLKELTVIGAGFASVMIGLSVDYGYFVYQRSLRHTGNTRELQWSCVQNIAWTASTTAAVFFSLSFCSLPGLSQLGNMVGIGVVIGACVMLGIFAPVAMKFHHQPGSYAPSRLESIFESRRFLRAGFWFAIVMIVVLLAGLAVKGMPEVDFSARTFKPRSSQAYDTIDRFYARMTDDRTMLSLVVRGRTEDEVLQRLKVAEEKLTAAQARGEVRSFRSALLLWPDVAHQRENIKVLSPLAADAPRLRQTLLDAGFNDSAFVLSNAVLDQWQQWALDQPPIWPRNETSQWILRRVAGREPGNLLALGIVEPTPGQESALAAAVQGDGVFLVSWDQLGRELKRVVPDELKRVIIVLSIVVLVIVGIGLRSLRAVLLFLLTTVLVLACLTGAMSLLGMQWGFFNMAAVLLLLGTGTDYSLLLLLALRRNGGDAPAAQRELGLVIALCCSSAAAGFGSISWANNLGLAHLGQTCALGLVIDAIISLFLLPRVWELWHRKPAPR